MENEKKNDIIIKILTALRFYLPPLIFGISINTVCAVIRECGGTFSSVKASGETAVIVSWVAIAVLSVVTMVFNAVKKMRPDVNSFALGAVIAFETYCFTESCMGSFAAKDSLVFFFAAPAFVYLFFLIGSIVFKKPAVYFIIVSVVFHIYGLLQFFVFSFRGAPVRASDLSNIASAMEISSEYSLVEGGGLAIIAIAVFSIATVVYTALSATIKPIKLKIRLALLPLLAVGLIFYGAFGIRLYDYGVENRIIKFNFSGGEDHWTYRKSGNVLMFYLDILNSGSNKPDGYSDDKAMEILSRYTEESKAEHTPTVIAIMDESLADFAMLGKLETNKDYMPFYHSLTENAIKGYVTVSAYGGYSCNSEFEFLTGNSMGFFPMGSAAYTQYVKTQQDSLVSYFKDLGYTTVSMAGCSKSLWKLGEAYEHIGFDVQYYKNNLVKPNSEIINGGLSDREMFSQLIKQYEKKKPDAPMFAFMTTMQNHASYKIPENPEITIEGIDIPEASAYLSYVYETDKALEMLINYFSQVDEDVVIVFYGDHYPHLPEFSEKLLGASLGTLSTEQNVKIHSTPFLIWANYDIEEQEDVSISLNYLSNKLIEACGMPKTDFQLFLDDVMTQVPSISSFGYKGADGKWYRMTDKSEYSDTLNEYNIVQYYRMFKKYED